MNKVLPRINLVGGRMKRLSAVMPTGNLGNMSGAKDHIVIPRAGTGVKAVEVLKTAGIARGGLVKVAPMATVHVEQKKAEKKPSVPFVRLVERPKPKLEWEPKITETERRLADFLEAAQEAKPLVDDVAEEQANATEPYDDPEFMKEQIEELPMEEGERPPIDIPEERKEEEIVQKKRRGRKKGSRKASKASKSE